MVSGFLTSPCDQERIFFGDARRIRIALKEVGSLGFSYKLNMLSKGGLLQQVSGFALVRQLGGGVSTVCDRLARDGEAVTQTFLPTGHPAAHRPLRVTRHQGPSSAIPSQER